MLKFFAERRANMIDVIGCGTCAALVSGGYWWQFAVCCFAFPVLSVFAETLLAEA